MQCIKSWSRQFLDVFMLRSLEFDDVVCRRMAEVGPHLRFIQIGVYDGITGDPLHKYIRKFGWREVLVEPQAPADEHFGAAQYAEAVVAALRFALLRP